MKRKVLLMGKAGSGKTSMRSIIFANYPPRDTMRLGPTYGFENTDVKFLGSLVLNLWDCGAQDAFMENYFESQRDQIFRNVEVLIYVFDVESQDKEKDMNTFLRCLTAIEENSKDARVFCLIHKMDLIPTDEQRQEVFREKAQQLTAHANVVQITCFGTSIWDETLYKAWSAVVYSLVPNVERLRAHLGRLCGLCQADEVVLFETATFLVIASAECDDESRRPADAHRYEKMSNIVKQFKLSCAKTQSTFQALEVASPRFTVLMESFTSNTCVMVILSAERVEPAAIRLNIAAARALFERFINS